MRCSHEYIALRRWLLARGKGESLAGFDTAPEAAHRARQYLHSPVGNPKPDDNPGGAIFGMSHWTKSMVAELQTLGGDASVVEFA